MIFLFLVSLASNLLFLKYLTISFTSASNPSSILISDVLTSRYEASIVGVYALPSKLFIVTFWSSKPASYNVIAKIASISSTVFMLLPVTSINKLVLPGLMFVILPFLIGGNANTLSLESTIIGYLFTPSSILPYSFSIFDV